MSIERQAITGIAWSGAARTVRVVVQFATAVALARLLTPQDFGLIAMITVLTNFAILFGEFGFSAALVQRPSLREGHLSSVFWLTLALGITLTVGVRAAAPWVAAFYREAQLEPLTRLVALNFLLASLRVVQTAVLSREMRFRAIGLVEVSAAAVGGAIGIGSALAGLGVWSLVAQLLAFTGAEAVGLWIACGWRPRLQFEASAIWELLPFSANFVGYSVINYWIRNADNLLIGRFVGSVGLGIYDRAYRTMLLPLSHTAGVLARVMFPTLSRIQEDRAAVKTLYLRSIRSVALLTFPMMLGLLVATDDFVLSLFGPKWTEVTPVLRILCLVGLIQSVSSTTGWIYQSQGRTDVMFQWGLLSGALTLAAFCIGILWGVTGVAVAYAVRSVLLAPPNFAIPGRFIGLRFGEVVTALRGTFACSLAMAAVVAGTDRLLPDDLSVYGSLAFQVAVGVAAYGAIVHLVGLDAYREARRAARTYWRLPSSSR